MHTTALLRLSILASSLIPFGIGPAASAQMAKVNSLVEGNTAFAFNLYADLSDTPGNLFFSPFSISTCLAMTYAGAGGDTKKQMGRVLRFSQGDARTHSSFGELQRERSVPQLIALSPEMLAQLNDAEKQKGAQLEIANALWIQKGEPFLPTFLKIVSDDYQADVKQADFETNADTARREVNDWVAQKTMNKIRDILPPESLDALTRLVLASAIYFKGTWASPFNRGGTSTQAFHISTNRQVDTLLMDHFDRIPYTSNDDFQVVELPYSGDELSMVILLPRQINGLGQLEKHLSPAFLDRFLSQMTKQRVRIELPRFKLECRFKLNETLEKMGMPDAFIPGKADFSKINGLRRGDRRSLYISDMFHKSWVQVTEEGTEAAAASVVTMRVGSAAPPLSPVFRADHPFIFLIRDIRSGSLLFLGRVADPSA